MRFVDKAVPEIKLSRPSADGLRDGYALRISSSPLPGAGVRVMRLSAVSTLTRRLHQRAELQGAGRNRVSSSARERSQLRTGRGGSQVLPCKRRKLTGIDHVAQMKTGLGRRIDDGSEDWRAPEDQHIPLYLGDRRAPQALRSSSNLSYVLFRLSIPGADHSSHRRCDA